jgi:hypothetical protein
MGFDEKRSDWDAYIPKTATPEQIKQIMDEMGDDLPKFYEIRKVKINEVLDVSPISPRAIERT